MFNWLKEDAEHKLFLQISLSRFNLNFTFEFYNIIFSYNIPLPHFNWNKFKTLYTKTTISPFARKYKNFDDCRRRYLEFDVYADSSLDTGIMLSIPHIPQDHDYRMFRLNFFGFSIGFTTYNDWHVCNCMKYGISRFPTPLECKEYLKYSNDLRLKMFKSKKLPTWKQCSKDKNLHCKLIKYYKTIEKYYNNIPSKDVIADI